MFDFFDKIIGFFETIWNVVLNLINTLITAISTLNVIIQLPTFLVPFLPSIILTGVITVVGFATVKFLIGR